MHSDATGYGSVTVNTTIPAFLVGRSFYLAVLVGVAVLERLRSSGNWHQPFGLSTSNGLVIVVQP